MTPKALLRIWEQEWGPLSAAQQQSFLQRTEVATLCSFDSIAVVQAVKAHRNLADIVETAKRTSSAMPNQTDLTSSKAQPTGGIGGTQASYGSGLAHNPGASEMPIGERCSHCDAFVPSGAVHDCT